jgi:hypothetical protein
MKRWGGDPPIQLKPRVITNLYKKYLHNRKLNASVFHGSFDPTNGVVFVFFS